MDVLTRIENLKKIMENKNVDCSLIYESRNIYYFSDTAQHCILLIPLDEEPILYVRRDIDRAIEESPLKNIRKINNSNEIYDKLKSLKIKSLGLEMDTLRARTYQILLQKFSSSDFVDLSQNILLLRSIKDNDELDCMRESAKVAEKVQEVSREFIKPGVSELDLAGAIQGEITKRGSIFSFFNHYWARNPFVLASGENIWGTTDFPPVLSGVGYHKSNPHGPSSRVIKEGDIVVVDVAPVINGYTSDHGRTYFVGKANEKFQKRYKYMLQAREKALNLFKDGVKISEIYETLLKNLPENLQPYLQGFNEYRVGMGHGIGLSLDELPFIVRKSKINLVKGNVIAFEPKIVIPGWGAINFEDDFIITKDGYEQITQSPFYEF